MNQPRRPILDDLARYLQDRLADGATYLLDAAGGSPAIPAQDARRAEAPAAPPAAPPAADPAAGSAEDRRQAARSARQRQFQAECDRFVREALDLIARDRSADRRLDPPVDDAEAALAAIAAEVRGCTRCALHAARDRAVPGTGDPRAGLVLIGEAPGQEEDRQGLPFVGRSGQLLTDILRAIGFAREDVFICNILKCRPPNNRDPEREEAAACAPFLARQLAVIRPRLILCLGRVAAQRLLATTASLGSLRRTLHFHGEVPVMATFHPAALLRNPAQKREAWDDVRKARALYDALGEDRSGPSA